MSIHTDCLCNSLLFYIHSLPFISVSVHGTLFRTNEPKPAHHFYLHFTLIRILSIMHGVDFEKCVIICIHCYIKQNIVSILQCISISLVLVLFPYKYKTLIILFTVVIILPLHECHSHSMWYFSGSCFTCSTMYAL